MNTRQSAAANVRGVVGRILVCMGLRSGAVVGALSNPLKRGRPLVFRSIQDNLGPSADFLSG